MKYEELLSELEKWKPVPAKATTPKGYRESDGGISCEKCYFFSRSYSLKPGRGRCSFYSTIVEEGMICDDYFRIGE